MLQVLAVKDNIRSKTEVLTFDFVDVSIAEFDLTIEESLIFDLYSFFRAISVRKGSNEKANVRITREPSAGAIYENISLIKETNANEEPSLLSLLVDELKDDITKERKVYIDQLFSGVVKLNLLYLKGKQISWDQTKQGKWAEGRLEKVLNMAGSEYLMKQLSLNRDESDIFMAWSRHTSEDESFARDNGKISNYFLILLAESELTCYFRTLVN